MNLQHLQAKYCAGLKPVCPQMHSRPFSCPLPRVAAPWAVSLTLGFQLDVIRHWQRLQTGRKEKLGYFSPSCLSQDMFLVFPTPHKTDMSWIQQSLAFGLQGQRLLSATLLSPAWFLRLFHEYIIIARHTCPLF